MTAQVIDGKVFAASVRARVAAAAAEFKKRQGVPVGLTVVLVGNDPASEIYVRLKVEDAREVGIDSRDVKLPATASEAEVLDVVRKLNADKSVHGVLVQFPTPRQVRQEAVLDTLSPDKDSDGLTPLSAGRLASGKANALVSCTPQGCLMLIKSVRPNLEGLNAVVIGRSQLVGKPMAQLLLQESCTVTIAHSKTKDLAAVTRSEHGAVAAWNGGLAEVAAEPIDRVVDTTGAGDLFAAGFLHGHVQGLPVEQCLRLGAICAAEIISHYGARPEADLKALVAEKLG